MTGQRVSVVLALDTWETGIEAIEALRRQTIAGHIEVVLVGPGIVVPPGAAHGFAAVLTVECPIHPLSVARARGIRAAREAVVYMAETHGFPQPDCLERLADALGGEVVAAMPQIVNANPETSRSWASLFATYGAFTGDRARSASYVALHNGAFRATFLQRVAARPEDLVYGVGLTQTIQREHLQAVYVPDAVVPHLNVERLAGVVMDRVVGGRLWAGIRSRGWSGPRRAVHAALFPIGAAVMTWRVLRSDGWRRHRGSTPWGVSALVAIWAGLQSCGEVAGYVTGPGDSERRHLPLELHRRAYMRRPIGRGSLQGSQQREKASTRVRLRQGRSTQ